LEQDSRACWCKSLAQIDLSSTPLVTPETPETPVRGKGLFRVGKSIPLPLPSHTLQQNPQGFANPCPSLLEPPATLNQTQGPVQGLEKKASKLDWTRLWHP
jgi:hypothetical protein